MTSHKLYINGTYGMPSSTLRSLSAIFHKRVPQVILAHHGISFEPKKQFPCGGGPISASRNVRLLLLQFRQLPLQRPVQ